MWAEATDQEWESLLGVVNQMRKTVCERRKLKDPDRQPDKGGRVSQGVTRMG